VPGVAPPRGTASMPRISAATRPVAPMLASGSGSRSDSARRRHSARHDDLIAEASGLRRATAASQRPDRAGGCIPRICEERKLACSRSSFILSNGARQIHLAAHLHGSGSPRSERNRANVLRHASPRTCLRRTTTRRPCSNVSACSIRRS
jgi:hypothetical protein